MAPDTSIPTRTLVLGCIQRDGSLDAADLYRVAEACGMTDLQVRLCLRRLVSAGVLEQVGGRGRRAKFVARGESATRILLPELEYVDFAYRQDAGLEPWDGRWRLVGISVSEHRRAARDEFRDWLRYHGGAPVHGGLYVSPHAWDELVLAEAERLDVADALTVIRSERLSLGGVTEPRELAARLWPLESVARGYEDFIRRLERRLAQASERAVPPSPEAVAGSAFATTLDFARAIEPDPLLPPELLPHRWPGAEARRRVTDAQRMLAGSGLSSRFPALFDRLAVARTGATTAARGSSRVGR